MAKQTVNIGTSPNSGDGDYIRDAFDKLNDNFDEVYDVFVFDTSSNNVTVANSILASSNNKAIGASNNKWNVWANNIVVSTVNATSINLPSANATANGFCLLPNGIKLNWGWVSSNNAAGSITFSSAFTTNAFSVVATSNSSVATYAAAVTAWTKTGASVRTTNAASINVFWMALGDA